MAGLVSELRRTTADPATSEPLRAAAARRLARLAPEVAMADPSSWWGTRAASRAVTPVRDPDAPVPVSASLLEQFATCPTRWFLSREAGGIVRAHQSQNMGLIVHAIAQRVAGGELSAGPDDVAALMEHVAAVWDRMEFRTPWARARELERVQAALGRFLHWHLSNPRQVIGVEEQFHAVLDLPGGEQVRLTGYADRLELDSEGRIVVVDLKTGRTKPSGPQVKSNLQLGLYQLAVDHGAVDRLDGLPGDRALAGGAELVQLGLTDGGPDADVQVQPQQAEDGPEREALRAGLAWTAARLRSEQFPAIAGEQCRDCPFVPLCPIKSAGPVVAQ
jgi:RecB family exonuclease